MSHGSRLRGFREARDLTQDQLAKLAGIPVVAVSRMETGARKVTLDEGVKLARALRITVDELAGVSKNAPIQEELEEYRASVLKELEGFKSRIEQCRMQYATV